VWPNNKKEEPPAVKQEGEKPPQAPSAEELLAKMGELLSPISQKLDSQSERLAALEESRKPKEPVNTEIPSVLDDENAAFNSRLTPIAVEHVSLRAMVIEDRVLRELKDFEEFLPQIRKELANTQVQVKAMPNYEAYVRNVINMVIGEEARKGGLRRDKQRFVLEDGSSSSDNTGSSTQSQEDKDFLNFHVTTGKGKVVTRGEYLKRIGIDVSNPEELKKVRETWATVQVVN
jgi:hypothetical protein